jgi:hypothetical protein
MPYAHRPEEAIMSKKNKMMAAVAGAEGGTKSVDIPVAPLDEVGSSEECRELESTESSAKPISPTLPSYEEISALAYSYWESRGCQGGSADEDWERAVTELARRDVG